MGATARGTQHAKEKTKNNDVRRSSRRRSAMSGMPQEGHPLDPLRDEAARRILKNLSPGEQPSLMNDKELAKDIPADVL
jgi:hypothetical protein